MSDKDKSVIHDTSDGGLAGRHQNAAPFQFFAATATSNELNTARLRPIPIACWRVDDIRFAFDSSFLTPDVATELQMLISLREAHKKTDAGGKAQYPPLSVFGHADPVGLDEYNKGLSGRRVTAVYALLISNTEPDKATKMWQEISGTENWGKTHQQAMQTATGLPESTAGEELVKAYMKCLCPPELALGSQDFLAGGSDPRGKGDYQGCSSFNPLLIFSQAEESGYEQAKQDGDQETIKERDNANAPNRRVVVLLFRPGSQVAAAKWPCPTAKEGAEGCRRRFWSDGEKRRKTRLPDERRKFDKTEDTFACRFYQRLTSSSPCERLEGPGVVTFVIRYQGTREPASNKQFLIQFPNGSRKVLGTDQTGTIRIPGWPEQQFTVIEMVDPACEDTLSEESRIEVGDAKS